MCVCVCACVCMCVPDSSKGSLVVSKVLSVNFNFRHWLISIDLACVILIFNLCITWMKITSYIQGVSKGQVNPYGGDPGPYLEQKMLIHFFPNSSPFPSYASITHLSSLDSMAILLLSSVVNCLYLVNCSVSPSHLGPTSSKGWLEQLLKMSPSRTNTCFISLISCCTLPSLRWCICIAVVLIFAMSSSLLPISFSIIQSLDSKGDRRVMKSKQ